MTPEHRRTFVGEGVNTQQQGNQLRGMTHCATVMRCAAESIFFSSELRRLYHAQIENDPILGIYLEENYF